MKRRAEPICRLPIHTREGEFVARYSGLGLCGLSFPTLTRGGRQPDGKQTPPARIQRWHAATRTALRTALAGKPYGRLPPLDLSSGTEFQQAVWRALRRIGWGRTRSYAQLARAVGNPKAVRAAGAACGANPIPVLVPCHRVLATGGGLGGFSAGLNWKLALLRREGSWPSARGKA